MAGIGLGMTLWCGLEGLAELIWRGLLPGLNVVIRMGLEMDGYLISGAVNVSVWHGRCLGVRLGTLKNCKELLPSSFPLRLDGEIWDIIESRSAILNSFSNKLKPIQVPSIS